MEFRQILDYESLDEGFCEYLEKRLEDKLVDELQIEIQVLIGDIMPIFDKKYPEIGSETRL